MTLIFDNNVDLSDRLLNVGGTESGDITDIFGLIAKQKKYVIKDYDYYYNPYADNGYFNLFPWRGRKIEETNDAGIVVFSGTVQGLEVSDQNEITLTAQEPMTIFLDFFVDTSDRTTHTGFLVNGFTAQGSQTIQIDTGSTVIPTNAVVSFNGAKNPSYAVITASGSPTNTITLDRPIELDIADNSTLSVAVPIETTAPLAIKNALQVSNPDIILDGSFDLLHIADNQAGYTIYLNIQEEDEVKLRDHLTILSDMADLYLLQKNDGSYSLRRGLDYNPTAPIEDLTGDEILAPVNPEEDERNLIIGYQCIYKSGTNEAKIAFNEVSTNYIDKYAGIKYWNPIKPAQFMDYRYLYANEVSATYFGERKLAYFREPKTTLRTNCKKSYNIDPTQEINITIGKQFNVSVRKFQNVKMIVTGYEYDRLQQKYTRLILQKNTL